MKYAPVVVSNGYHQRMSVSVVAPPRNQDGKDPSNLKGLLGFCFGAAINRNTINDFAELKNRSAIAREISRPQEASRRRYFMTLDPSLAEAAAQVILNRCQSITSDESCYGLNSAGAVPTQRISRRGCYPHHPTPMPWLADAARIERAWLDAHHTADAEPLAPAVLASFAREELADLAFVAHPCNTDRPLALFPR